MSFTAGGRVAIPFRPRAADGWLVDGSAPLPLPAGALSGSALRNQSDAAAMASVPEAQAAVDTSTAEPDAAATEVTAVSPRGLHREVFGFLPSWTLGDRTTVLDYSTLSTVAYFGVGCAPGGNLAKQNADGSASAGWAGWTSQALTAVIDAAHRAGTRVVLTVQCFAWTGDGATLQASILRSATARTRLARQIVAAVRSRGADGVNLDFEPLSAGSEAGFTALVRTVRANLDRAARGYQLTFDTMGRIANYPVAAATAPGGADAVLVMGYDYRTSGSAAAGSISPLAGPAYDLADTIAAYLEVLPASKVILGVPYYGRAWSVAAPTPNGPSISGTVFGTSVTTPYRDAVELAAAHGRRWDAVELSPWTAYRKQVCGPGVGCRTVWRELYYDDATSLGLRYDLINRSHLRGAAIWALGYDGTRPELRRLLAAKFLRDSTPPVAAITALGRTQRDTGFRVAWAATDDGTIRGYDVEVAVDGGRWTSWRAQTTATADVFLGSDGHSYAFRVRATDEAGNASAWATSGPTRIQAGIVRYLVASGGQRVVTPDGPTGTIVLSWTNTLPFDSLTLRVFAQGRGYVGSRPLGQVSSGPHALTWDGTIGGRRLAPGSYVLQLLGVRGSTTYTAPSAWPISDQQLVTVGIALGPVPPTSVAAFGSSPTGATTSTTLTFVLVFGGPVTDLAAVDFIRSGTARGCRVGTPTGSGTTYTVALTGCSQGTVTLSVRPGAVRDAVGNRGPLAPVAAPLVVIDRTAPEATAPLARLISGSASDPGLPATIAWSGADRGGSGIAAYDVARSTDGGRFTVIASGLTATALRSTLPTGHTYRFEVRARDRAGNVGGWSAGATTSVALRQDADAGWTFSSGWHRVVGTAYSGGSISYSTTAGASARLAFTGRSIAILVETGPSHGQVRVEVDGVDQGTVDTVSPATSERQIVWARSWATSATHVIRLVVVGTAGRPSVTLDAVAVLR